MTNAASAKFWDRIAERYARQPVADEAAYQRKLEVTREYFRPDTEVLEFGCGSGSTAIGHAPYVRHILAIDVSGKMLDIARAKAEAAGARNVTFRQATIEALDAPDASFDAVLGMSILHLVADRDAVIAKVYRLLRPGGVFVSSTACLGDGMKFIRYIEPLGRLVGLMPMVKVFTEAELAQSIADAGFAIEHQWRPDTDKRKAVFIVARKTYRPCRSRPRRWSGMHAASVEFERPVRA
jgi:SAM-dependent methyltransferase